MFAKLLRKADRSVVMATFLERIPWLLRQKSNKFLHSQMCNKLQPNEITPLCSGLFEAIRCAAACRRKTREASLIKDWNSLQRDFIRKTVNETTWNKKQRLSYKRKFKKYFLYPEKKYPHKSSCDLL